MLQRTLLVSLILLLLLPVVASAQKFEVTPFVGYRFGGGLNLDLDFFEPVDLELDEGESLGLILGIAVHRGLQVELIWSHQETTLLDDGGLFTHEVELFDIDVDYYHVGVAYQWAFGQVRPFMAGSLGITELDPLVPGLQSETRFSIGVGGGVKLMVAKNLGFRFEGRLLATELDEDTDEFCSRNFCYAEDDELTQGEVRAGLVIAF